MKAFLLLFAIFCCVLDPAFGQAPANASRLHADVNRLLEVDGTKQFWRKNLKQVVAQGRTDLIRDCRECSPVFVDQWEKRMLARIHAEDFINIFIEVYEKHFSDEDVLALTAMMKAGKGAGAGTLPPDVRRKIDAVLPAVQREIAGEILRFNAKTGSEVSLELSKEHPEYLKDEAKAPSR